VDSSRATSSSPVAPSIWVEKSPEVVVIRRGGRPRKDQSRLENEVE
jgi:hypothetical protein